MTFKAIIFQKDNFSKGERLAELHTDSKSVLETDTVVFTYNTNCCISQDAPCPQSAMEFWNKAGPRSGSGFAHL